jgi:7-keto-8-aminopelargonate synthetase-like enzyme
MNGFHLVRVRCGHDLRLHSHATCYSSSMSAPVVYQIITALSIIMGRDGTNDGKRIDRSFNRFTAPFHSLARSKTYSAIGL